MYFSQDALHRAALRGDHNSVERMLANKDLLTEVNCRDEDGNTPLHSAALNGHGRVVLILLADPRVDVNCSGKHGATPLVMAADAGNVRVLKILLADLRVEINASDKEGYTSLHAAAVLGRPRVVQLLLEDKRLDVNCTTSPKLSRRGSSAAWLYGGLYEGATPLHLAAQYNHAEVVQLLLADPRTEVNCKNKRGATPLMHHVMTALVENSLPTLRLLLNHPSVDLKDIKEVAR